MTSIEVHDESAVHGRTPFGQRVAPSTSARARFSSFVNTAMGSWSAVLGIYAVSPKATRCPFVVERTHFAGAELGASCWVASASRIGRRDVDMSVAVAAAAAASKRRVILAVELLDIRVKVIYLLLLVKTRIPALATKPALITRSAPARP